MTTVHLQLKYRVDPHRKNCNNVTGIYVRGWLLVDGYDTVDNWDIACLDRESLERWLASKPGLTLNTLLTMLGHPQGSTP